MDEKNKDTLAGAGLGITVGGLLGGPPGAVIGGLVGGAFGSHEERHQELIRQTHYTLSEQTSENATHYVDHIDPDGCEPGNTQNVLDGVDGKPDLIVTDPGNMNLIIEAETWNGIQNDQQHALEQLEDFRKRGYKRLLVTPEEDIEQVTEWVENQEQKGNIGGPELTIASPAPLKQDFHSYSSRHCIGNFRLPRCDLHPTDTTRAQSLYCRTVI
jgi:hypothetical protein